MCTAARNEAVFFMKVYADKALKPILTMEERILARIGEEECRQLEKTTEKFATFFTEEFLIIKKIKSF